MSTEHCRPLVDEFLERLCSSKNSIRVALPTGQSPLPFYELLLKSMTDQSLLKKLKIFVLDEFCDAHGNVLPSTTVGTPYLEQELKNSLESFGLQDEQFIGWSQVQDYQQELKSQPLDWILLGLGSNGHIAFNEPGSSEQSTCRIVELTQSSRQQWISKFGTIEQSPSHAWTIGLKEIMQSSQVRLLYWGLEKKSIAEQCFQGPPIYNPQLPASILKQHTNLKIISNV